MNYYYIQNGFIHFNFKFDTELIASIKQITGRVFNPATKEWYVPLTITNGTPINTIITKFKFEKRDHTSLLGGKSTFELEKIDPIEMDNLKKELLSKGLGISPRGEFQWEGIYWMSVWGNMILGDLMGLGKTPQTIFTAELNDWFPCLVICPASTKYQWRDLWLKANPKRIIDVIESQRDNNWGSDVVIINWDLLSESDGTKISRGKEVKNIVPKFNEILRDWKYCVLDEVHYCFTFDTKVITSCGLLKIGDIVEKKINCQILSYNISLKKQEYKDINDYLCYGVYEDILEIKTENNTLHCTENHKIYTKDGYKKAREITSGDYLFTMSNSILDKKERESHSKILFKFLFHKKQTNRCGVSKKRERKIREAEKGDTGKGFRDLCLLSMWKRIFEKKFFRATILREKLFGKVENVARRNKGNIPNGRFQAKNFRRDEEGTQEKSRNGIKLIKENEGKQSIKKQRNCFEDNGFKKNKWNSRCVKKSSRRERKINRASIKIISLFVKLLSKVGVCCIHERVNGTIQNSIKLQNRFSFPRINGRSRDRWAFTRQRKSKSNRQKERHLFEFERVESVKVYQQYGEQRHRGGGSRNNKVYCLSINDNNNFFAENILVSNCKSTKAGRSQLALKIANKSKYVVGLSGTLTVNKTSEIIHPLKLIKQFNKLFGSWDNFVKRYCNAKKTPFGWDTSGSSNLFELNEILRKNCYLRREKSDVKNDLPPTQETYYWVELSNKKEYLKAQNDIASFILKKYGEEKLEALMGAEMLVQRTQLKQLSIKGKIKAIKQWIDDYLENTDEKLMVAGVHTEPLVTLSTHYKCELLNGSINSLKKREMVQRFEKSKDRILFTQMKAVGTGTDGLQNNCSNMLIIELPDTPAERDQLVSRLDRDGQQQMVSVNYILCKESVDIIIKESLEVKQVTTKAINKGVDHKEEEKGKTIKEDYL